MNLRLWREGLPSGPGAAVSSVTTALDASGSYWAAVEGNGTLDVQAKASHWLSARQSGTVFAAENVPLDWSLGLNGDVDGDNSVSLLDLGAVLTSFETSVPMADLDGNWTVGLNDLGIVVEEWPVR